MGGRSVLSKIPEAERRGPNAPTTTDTPYELPDGWNWAALESTLVNHRGGVWGDEAQRKQGYPVLRSTNMRGGKLDFSEVARCNISDDVAKQAALVSGDIIVSKSSGSPHLVGLPVLFEGSPDGQTYLCSNFTMRLRPNEKQILPKFLFHFLAGAKAETDRRSMAQDTTGLRNLKVREYLAQTLPLPPLPEQRRIVARIETLFTESRTAREALERVPALLKRFRQSVLAAAFRGNLTERDPNDEPAYALLEHIRAERVGATLRGRPQSRGTGQPHRVAPTTPDTSNLPELPDGWVWTNLGSLAQIRNGVTKGRNLSGFKTIEVPYLRVANVQDGYLDLNVVKTISIKADELEKYKLHPNDILFIEGGDRDKLGRGTVWRGEIEPCIHQNHVHCARLFSEEILPDWITLASSLQYARDYFYETASQTVNLASLNATGLKALPIPLAPLAEQRRIVAKIESLFAQADAIERAVAIARRRADKVDQAILARAFRGEL